MVTSQRTRSQYRSLHLKAVNLARAMVNGKPKTSFPALLVALALTGCGDSAEIRARLQMARTDFLAHQGDTGFDAAADEFGASPALEFPELREFKDCSVRRASMFEQFSASPEVELWAVELEFTGTDVETGEREDGRAILLYRAFRQIGEEGRLIGIFPGTAEDEIRMIREGTKAAFEFLRSGG